MAVEIRVPRLGWSMEEGGFVGWLRKDGDEIQAGEPLYTLEGDKATQEVEASDSGILRIPPDAPQPGSTVVVGALLGYLVAPNESPPAAPGPGGHPPQLQPQPSSAAPASGHPTPDTRTPRAPSAEAPPSSLRNLALPPEPVLPHSPAPPASVVPGPEPVGRIAISPRALRFAVELGVDWTRLNGTGRSGRIRSSDVLAAAAVSPGSATRSASAAPTRNLSATAATPLRPPAQIPPGTIVFTDWTFPDLTIEEAILRPLGARLVSRQCGTEQELVALVAEADCVITQFARLNAQVVAAMHRARAIVRYGIGVDNIDLEAARKRGIPVCNVPDYCIDEVADQTLAFLLALTRQVLPHAERVRAGQWGLAVPIERLRALADLTVGVVGCGRIGRAVLQRLRAFHCRILVHDPAVKDAEVENLGATPVRSLAELLPACDALTLHCPSTAETRHMLNAGTLAAMKAGALLINVARGDLIDTAALVACLQDGHLAAAALDVCDPEPIPAEHPLLKLPNVVLAPHIASVSPRAVRTLRETVATLAALALTEQLPPNVVNGVVSPRAPVPGSRGVS